MSEEIEQAADFYYEYEVTLSRAAEEYGVDYQQLYDYVTEERYGLITAYSTGDVIDRKPLQENAGTSTKKSD